MDVTKRGTEHLNEFEKSTTKIAKFGHLKKLTALREKNQSVDAPFQTAVSALKEDDIRPWLKKHKTTTFEQVKKDPKLAHRAISYTHAHHVMQAAAPKFTKDKTNNAKQMQSILSASIAHSTDCEIFQKEVWRLHQSQLPEAERQKGYKKFLEERKKL